MSTDHHSPVAAGAAQTVASVNTPLGQLDNAVKKTLNGTQAFYGLLMDVSRTETIVGGTINLTKMHQIIAPETSIFDELHTINTGAAGNVAVLRAAAGTTIVVKANTGTISVPHDIWLTGNRTLILYKFGTNWYEFGYYASIVIGREWTTSLEYATKLVFPTNSEKATASGDATSVRLRLIPSGEARTTWGVRCQGGTNHASQVTVTAGGTVAAANNDTDVFNSFTLAATAGLTGGLISANFTQWRLNHYPVYAGRFMTPTDLTSQRVYVGLTAAAMPNSDTLANEFVGFRYSSVAADAGWRPVSYDGATQTLAAAITPALAVSTVYDFRLAFTGSGVELVIRVGGVDYTATITALPAFATDLGFVCVLVQTANAPRVLRIGRLYGESGAFN